MPCDDDLRDALQRLGNMKLTGCPHERQRQEVRSLLFGTKDEVPQERIGRFILLGQLGSGGMGVVFRAHDDTLHREVALKVMREHVRSLHGQRLLREAQALAKLTHPNVVHVYEVGTANDRPFIAMQLIEGKTLAAWQESPRSWSECVDAYLQAGCGLAAAHAAGLVHRDFKPRNCMIDEQGVVRVLDFGLAREAGQPTNDNSSTTDAIESAESTVTGPAVHHPRASGSLEASISMLRMMLTQTGSVMGTRAFMAPEQLAYMRADAHSDQFSFCVALYEALYGRRPFSHDSLAVMVEMAEGIHHEPFSAPERSKVPRWLQRIVWRGLSARPIDRWPSMQALLDEIERCRPTPKRWTPWLNALVGMGLTLGVTKWAMSASTEPSCERSGHVLDGLWNEDHKSAVRQAMFATDVAHADHTWTTVQRQLDHHVEQLGRAYVEACEARVLDVRQPCLDHQRLDLEGRIHLLRSIDKPDQVDGAVGFTAQISPVTDCHHDVEHHRSNLDVFAAYEDLENVRRLVQFGHPQQGLDELDATMGRIEQLGDQPLVAEALQVAGQLDMESGNYDTATRRFERAHRIALAHGADDTAIGAMAALVHLVGVRQARTRAAMLFASTAEAIATRPRVTPLRQAELLTAEAQVHTSRGEHAKAQRAYTSAIALLEEARGPDHIALVDALDGLGTAADGQGRLADAEAAYRRALEIRQQWQGDLHPSTAFQKVNLGVVLARWGRKMAKNNRPSRAAALYEQAIHLYQEALEVYEAREPDHDRIAHARSNLGAAFRLLDRYDEAERQMRVAIHHWNRTHDTDHPRLAIAHINLGVVLAKQSRPVEAAEHYERALQILLKHEGTPQLVHLIRETLRKLEHVTPQMEHSTTLNSLIHDANAKIAHTAGEHDPWVTRLRQYDDQSPP